MAIEKLPSLVNVFTNEDETEFRVTIECFPSANPDFSLDMHGFKSVEDAETFVQEFSDALNKVVGRAVLLRERRDNADTKQKTRVQ